MQPEFKGLEVEGLCRRVGGFELQADFRVDAGERLVIQAPSGSGKSTLLRILAGLEPLDRGTIRLGGRDLAPLAAPQRQIGVVFQETALIDSLSVGENAAFGLRMRGVSKSERLRSAELWLEKVHLGDRLNASTEGLSGGEKQRLAFVRALIWEPSLLLLDEPFSALDPGLRHGLRTELLALLKTRLVPMILVTHDRDDADVLATLTASIIETSPGVRCLK